MSRVVSENNIHTRHALAKAIMYGVPEPDKNGNDNLQKFADFTVKFNNAKKMETVLKKLKNKLQNSSNTRECIVTSLEENFIHQKLKPYSPKEIKDTKKSEGVSHISNEQMYGKGSNSKKETILEF